MGGDQVFGEESCAPGHSGRICGRCLPAWYRGGRRCFSCSSLADANDPEALKSTKMATLMGGMSIMLIFLLSIMLYLKPPSAAGGCTQRIISLIKPQLEKHHIDLAMAKAHFGPHFDYADGQQREFKMSLEYIRAHRPWNVVKCFGNRETSLCRYHMQWDFIAAALWTWSKTLRDRKLVSADLAMTIPKDAYDFRRLLVCPRTNEDSPYDNFACRDEKCDRCKDLQLLDGPHGLITREELTLGADVSVK